MHAPSSETVPLVCRVWRNLGLGHSDDGPREDRHMEGRETGESWTVLKSLYEAAPEVLRFPVSLADYAAIGSRYWNIGHPKIAKTIALLIELSNRLRQRRLSAETLRKIRYLTSTSFYGFTVPSRMSGARLALEVPNRLLDIADEEGLGRAERFMTSDFYPGTVGAYQNPYHFDRSGWKTHGTGLGQRLGETPEN